MKLRMTRWKMTPSYSGRFCTSPLRVHGMVPSASPTKLPTVFGVSLA